MSNTSYYLYQKYEQRGGQDPIPAYPNYWSVDGDGTMPKVKKMDNDPSCGYVPPVTAIYRWVNIDITKDYVCDECPQYRTISTGYTCVGYDKHYLDEYQVSYDAGATWQTLSSSTGSLIETDSEYCGYQVIERWVVVSGDYECSGTTKYTKERKEISYDGGTTWTQTSDYRRGSTVIEYNSIDCGYVPPTPTGGTKFSATYSGGTTYSAECDSSTELTTATTRPSGYDKEKMLSAVVGDCVTSIGDRAFYYCIGLTSIDIPDSVTSIGEQTFEDCISLANINIPSGVTSIGNHAFENCSSLTSIDIPNSVTSIGNHAFQSCSGLTSCTIGSGVTSIGYYVFQDCSSLSSIVIPSGVTSIGDGAFEYCYGLTSIDIPDSVTSIGDWVFYECTGLTSIVIPSGVTSIGIYAFADCSSLSSITVNAATPPTLDNVYVFDNTNNCPILVPSQSVDTYKTASEWSTYADRIQAII